MRAILVSVDYADLLSLTLPYNRHHFDDVMVVTSLADTETHEIADQNNARVFSTNAFYDNEAIFNKWKALEQGLDAFGRTGWLCIMDADVLWPKILPPNFCMEKYKLYTPYRRMYPSIPQRSPPEEQWSKYPLHRQKTEWAGYSQIFHAEDPCLGEPPWHEQDWTHAGGADSFFQRKWDKSNKVRPNWEVLHLGQPGQNWCGRVSTLADGSTPSEAFQRQEQLQGIFKTRRKNGNFKHEKLPPPS